jgi:hypothetical protein
MVAYAGGEETGLRPFNEKTSRMDGEVIEHCLITRKPRNLRIFVFFRTHQCIGLLPLVVMICQCTCGLKWSRAIDSEPRLLALIGEHSVTELHNPFNLCFVM